MRNMNLLRPPDTSPNTPALRGQDSALSQPEVIVPYPVAIQAPPPADTVSFNGLFTQLWRRRWLIAGMTLAGMLAGLALAVLTPPSYQARATLQLEGFNNDTFYRDLSPVSPLVANAPAENYLQNQVALLRSDTLARRVAEKLGIGVTPPPAWARFLAPYHRLTGQTPASPEQARLLAVQHALDVRTTRNSEILEIHYSASTPARAAQGADTVAAEFIALNREHRDALVESTTEWLGKQTGELKARLEAASQALHTYAASSGIVFSGPEDQSTLAKERMRHIEDALTAAQTERAASQARFETALAAKPEALPEGVLQGDYRQSVTELQNLRRQLADLKTLFTPAHPKVKSLEAQISELEKTLAQERTEAVARLRTDYLTAVGLEVRLASAHAEQLKTLQSQAAMSTRYTLLKREVETMQQVYDAMLQKEKEASMAAALRATNVRIIDPAQPPTSPRSPNFPLHLSLGFAFGCFGGLALTVLRERADILRQPGDAADLNVPELGAIPSARLDRALHGSGVWPLRLGARRQPLELVTWREENSLLSESFRATLASILFRVDNGNQHSNGGAPHGGQTFVFTSVEPVEGKTTVATNLAVALAETNKKVLLVDADMRRPRIHSIFNLCNDWGLSDLLEGDGPAPGAPLDAVARPTQIPNLWVLPSGPGTAVISRLLYSPTLDKLLLQLRGMFDLILVDSPPLDYYSDARVFGHVSDGVVLVVRANKTCRETLRTACARLVQDGIPILGTVLNDWSFDDSHRRSYSDYYRYKPV